MGNCVFDFVMYDDLLFDEKHDFIKDVFMCLNVVWFFIIIFLIVVGCFFKIIY